MENTKRQSLIDIIIVSAFAIIFVTVFCWASSPLTSQFYGYDSIWYKLLGKGMLDGIIPFKDISSQKGAFLIYIEAIGEYINRLLHSPRLGTYFIEIINAVLYSIITYKTVKIICSRFFSYIAILLSLVTLCPTVEGGNFTEEYSLPWLALSLYLVMAFIYKNDLKCTWKSGAIQGILFAIVFWIRPNNASIICAVVLFYAIVLIVKKEYKLLFVNIISFSICAAVLSALILAYYAINGAMNDLIAYCFSLNFSYIKLNSHDFSSTLKFLLIIFTTPLCSLIILLKSFKKTNELFYLSMLNVCIDFTMMIFYLIAGIKYPHYLQFISLELLQIIVLLYLYFKENKLTFKKQWVIITSIILMCISLLPYVKSDVYVVYESAKLAIDKSYDINEKSTLSNLVFASKMKEIIPKNERTSVSVPVPCVILYYASDTYPFYRDATDDWIKRFSPELTKDFYNHFYQNPPKWVVFQVSQDENESQSDMKKYVVSHYDLVYSDGECDLYNLR